MRRLTRKDRECPYCRRYVPAARDDAHLARCRREAKALLTTVGGVPVALRAARAD